MIIAYIFITTVGGKEKKILDLVRGMEEVSEAYRLYGEYDIIVKIEVPDLKDIDRFVFDKLRPLPDIRQTSTMIAM